MSRAEHERRTRNLFRVNRRHVAGSHRLDLEFESRLRAEPVEALEIAAVRRDHLLELLERQPLLQLLAAHRPRLVELDLLLERHHQRRQLNAQLHHLIPDPRSPIPSAKHFQCFADLVRIPDREPERRIHVGDERGGLASRGLRPGDERVRERNGVLARLHERALAALHVEDERVRALGELFGEDGGDDERNRGDRARHVAERVELLVRRRDVIRLHRERDADRRRDLLKAFDGLRAGVAGNRLQLVGRPACEAEAASGQRGNADAASCGERLDDERKLVADAAGGVLVGRRDIPCKAPAGLHHRVRQVGGLALGHPAAADGHGEGGHLVIRDLPLGEALDELADLRAAEGMSLALLVQYQLCDHVRIISYQNSEPTPSPPKISCRLKN